MYVRMTADSLFIEQANGRLLFETHLFPLHVCVCVRPQMAFSVFIIIASKRQINLQFNEIVMLCVCVCVCVLNLHIYRQDIYILRGRSNKPNRCTKQPHRCTCGVANSGQFCAIGEFGHCHLEPKSSHGIFVFFCVLWQHSLLNFCSFLTGCFD